MKILLGTLGLLGITVFSMMFWLILLTPEKTINGQYTQPFKYWTDDVYFQQNFIGGNNANNER